MRINKEEKQKLYAEVNQIVNQRFLLNTAAIVMFGIVLAWATPWSSQTSNSNDYVPICIVSVFLLILLFSLYYISHLIRLTMRAITIYLIINDASQWEKDWKEYRSQKPYYSYTKGQAVLFSILGLSATLWPYLFFFITKKGIPFNSILLVSSTVVGVFYLVLVIGMGFKDWWYSESEIKDKWMNALSIENK